ncbi:hypothetical protein RIF29_25665 [Crotalaria pallida]|uniref:Protein kinase domain-containing protein n=1 Tax=Crotalaria pallida TaxID=3830 RepID=A0AAN9EMR5_CROPI
MRYRYILISSLGYVKLFFMSAGIVNSIPVTLIPSPPRQDDATIANIIEDQHPEHPVIQQSDEGMKARQSFYDNGVISIILEYMDGGSLADLLKKVKTIPEPYLAAIWMIRMLQVTHLQTLSLTLQIILAVWF